MGYKKISVNITRKVKLVKEEIESHLVMKWLKCLPQRKLQHKTYTNRITVNDLKHKEGHKCALILTQDLEKFE